MWRRACYPAHVARLLPKCERAHCHVLGSRPQPLCTLRAKCADWAFVPAWVLVLITAMSHIQHVQAFILHKSTVMVENIIVFLSLVNLFIRENFQLRWDLSVITHQSHSLLLSHLVGRYVSPSWCLVWREVTLLKEAKWGFFYVYVTNTGGKDTSHMFK